MTARPILFSGDMVRALLDGRKSQTRRVVKNPQPAKVDHPARFDPNEWAFWHDQHFPTGLVVRCPYGKPGDLLWVRETWAFVRHTQSYETGGDDCFWEWDEDEYGLMSAEALTYCPRYTSGAAALCYAADGEDKNPTELYPTIGLNGRRLRGAEIPWRPSIHMPRWASRLTLRITDVRVQRVQEISEEDAKGEGCGTARFRTDVPVRSGPLFSDECYRAGYACLWDSLNAARGYGWQANPWVWVLTFEVIRANVDSVDPVELGGAP